MTGDGGGSVRVFRAETVSAKGTYQAVTLAPGQHTLDHDGMDPAKHVLPHVSGEARELGPELDVTRTVTYAG